MNDPKVIEQVIADSEALLKAAAPAFEAQAKLAALEPQFEAATAELAAARAEIQKNAEQAADFFIAQNALTLEKRAAFVDRLVKNPGELFGAMQNYADAISAREPGAPGGMDKAAGLDASVDPLTAFCMS